MRMADAVKPLSFVKGNAAGLIREVTDNRSVVVITQNGEATAVLQGIDEYEKTQESLALLKILALGRSDYNAGKVESAREVFASVRKTASRQRTS